MPTTTWHPSRLLTGNSERPYAIIILNQPINKNAFLAVCDQAKMLVCADAGANKLLELQRSNPSVAKRLPDVIIGDLDSLSTEAEQHFRERGVQIVKDPDQYSTDFTKALKWIRRKAEEQEENEQDLDVVVSGGLGGRVDQGFSQIHYLYLASADDSLLKGRVYLLSEQSLTFILDAGENQIFIEADTFNENIGIIPVLGPTKISTKGLEWDVEDWPTEIGGQLSTSNHLRSDMILINVAGTKPLLTIELAKPFCMTSF